MNLGKLFKRKEDKPKVSIQTPNNQISWAKKMHVGEKGTVILDSDGILLTAWPNSEKGFRYPRPKGTILRRLNEQEIKLLKECLEKHRAFLLDKLPVIETGELEDSVINEMRNYAVGNELLKCGFDDKGNPNEYGLKLEDLIGTLSHYWKSQRKMLKGEN